MFLNPNGDDIEITLEKVEWTTTNSTILYSNPWENATIFRFHSLIVFNNPLNETATSSYHCSPANWYLNISAEIKYPSLNYTIPIFYTCNQQAIDSETFISGITKKLVFGDIVFNQSSLGALLDGNYSFSLYNLGWDQLLSQDFFIHNKSFSILGNSTNIFQILLLCTLLHCKQELNLIDPIMQNLVILILLVALGSLRPKLKK